MQADIATALNEPARPSLAADAPATAPLRLDVLARDKPRCPVARADEIVVCAQDQEEFRLRPLDPRFAKREADPAGVALAEGIEASVQQGTVGGWPSNRIMIRAQIKF